jgi:hypothetical protein
MPAYNFQAQFVEDIEAGRKIHTIRPIRKYGNPFAGVDLTLYTGMRTKSCRLIRRVACYQARKIEINLLGGVKLQAEDWILGVDLELYRLSQNAIVTLALNDGFTSIDAFYEFFITRYMHTNACCDGIFSGLLIEWKHNEG